MSGLRTLKEFPFENVGDFLFRNVPWPENGPTHATWCNDIIYSVQFYSVRGLEALFKYKNSNGWPMQVCSNAKDDNGYTALYFSLRNRDLLSTRFLISMGANVNCSVPPFYDHLLDWALMCLTSYTDGLLCINILVTSGAIMNAKNLMEHMMRESYDKIYTYLSVCIREKVYFHYGYDGELSSDMRRTRTKRNKTLKDVLSLLFYPHNLLAIAAHTVKKLFVTDTLTYEGKTVEYSEEDGMLIIPEEDEVPRRPVIPHELWDIVNLGDVWRYKEDIRQILCEE